MDLVLNSAKDVYVVTKLRKKHIDNIIFRLHSKITVTLFIICGSLVCCKQFFGEPIHCLADDNNKIADAVNAYCWIHSTFTLENPDTDDRVGKTAAAYGVRSHKDDDKEIYHHYYQWVSVILYMQAFAFYMPYFIWKLWEGGLIELLTSDLDATKLQPEKWDLNKKQILARYFADANGHTLYIIRYTICEMLNLLNVVSQIIILDIFLDKKFKFYGVSVVSYLHNFGVSNSTSIMTKLFPKTTKCTFHLYGPSGDVQYRDLLCILPLNIINEKVFLVIWFWLVILTIVSCLHIIYRTIVFCCPYFRVHCMMRQARTIPRSQIVSVVNKFNIGDWFLLLQLSKNLSPIVFRELIEELDGQIEKKIAMI